MQQFNVSLLLRVMNVYSVPLLNRLLLLSILDCNSVQGDDKKLPEYHISVSSET